MTDFIIAKVRVMRAAQRDYFRGRTKEQLELCKRLELEVDELLDPPPLKPRGLFDGQDRGPYGPGGK